MLVALVLGVFVWLSSCDRKEVSPQSDYAKARVLANSCAGVVLQFIGSGSGIGKDWIWYENLNVHKPSDPLMIYQHTVNGFSVPINRIVVGDTLEFRYRQITQPPGPRCALQFGPDSLIDITSLKE